MLPRLTGNSVQAGITSPPYHPLRDGSGRAGGPWAWGSPMQGPSGGCFTYGISCGLSASAASCSPPIGWRGATTSGACLTSTLGKDVRRWELTDFFQDPCEQVLEEHEMPMTLPPRPEGLQEVISVFGDPRPFVNTKAVWEESALAMMPLAVPLIYAYDASQSVRRVRAHRLMVEHLVATLQACLAAGVPLQRMKYGGCYQWRPKRTAAQLSLHTWGIAVDLEPAENPLGEPWADDGRRLHPAIIDTFKKHGWFWGGEFEKTLDPQHFQWATGV